VTIESRTVDWWSVHQYVEPLLKEVGSWPMVGSLPWQHLPTDDPAKLAAVLDAARHWALRLDCCQEARADASKAVAASADWPAVARELRRLDAARRAGTRIGREQTIA
jgi:hypothetical protein